MYEFVCEACGERFEALVDVGTEASDCRTCGAPGARRVLSVQAPSPHLVRTPGDARKQGRKNAELQKRSRQEFKAARARQREQKKSP